MVLGEMYLKVFGRLGATAYEALNEQQLLNNAKQLVVKKRNKYVHRYRLTHMKQGSDEAAINFETRLQPLARVGKFKKKGKCACGSEVEIDYTDKMVLDNFIRGIADEEISQKSLR